MDTRNSVGRDGTDPKAGHAMLNTMPIVAIVALSVFADMDDVLLVCRSFWAH
jgi:hypothetical protein